MKKAIWIIGCALVVLGCASAWLLAAPAVAPTIDSVAATPAYVFINTPTVVTFTARITDPNVQAGVNLLKTDAAGKTLSTVGTMLDNGTSGDAVAGDKTFTLRITLTQVQTGATYYRVSAPFKGLLQRVLSVLVSVPVWQRLSVSGTGISLSVPGEWQLEAPRGDGTEMRLFVAPVIDERDAALKIRRLSTALTPQQWFEANHGPTFAPLPSTSLAEKTFYYWHEPGLGEGSWTYLTAVSGGILLITTFAEPTSTFLTVLSSLAN